MTMWVLWRVGLRSAPPAPNCGAPNDPRGVRERKVTMKGLRRDVILREIWTLLCLFFLPRTHRTCQLSSQYDKLPRHGRRPTGRHRAPQRQRGSRNERSGQEVCTLPGRDANEIPGGSGLTASHTTPTLQ